MRSANIEIQTLKNMIGRDDDNEEVSYKVADRRKFNPDGSVREGVVLDAPKPEVKAPEPEEKIPAETAPAPGFASDELDELQDELNEGVDDPDNADMPGADNPASFVNFLSTLATNAAASLGAVPHPVTGKRSLDLDTGKYWLDVLGMIKDKTSGNLHEQENRLLDGLLADLRMQYVTMVRATEEKLKEQAAKKFSGADILGKK